MESTKEKKLSSINDLHLEKSTDVLIRSHDGCVAFHAPNMEMRELCYDFLANKHWTPEEEEVAKQKGKALVTFNKLIPSMRTFVGSILQQRYDVKPAPREPNDQNKSDIYTAMYHWTADITKAKFKDSAMVMEAWTGGSAWQESFVEITPGRQPRIIVTNQNNFAIYPDPNRKDLIDNSDCEFIDRVSWLSAQQIIDAYPDKEEEILAALVDQNKTTYEEIKLTADRAHEYQNYRNGKYKVIERFYKVRKKMWYGEANGQRIDVGYDVDRETRDSFKSDYPNHNLYMEKEEYLYLATAVPSMGGGDFLYNDLYHCQPRDSVTGKIIFTLTELIDEDLCGQPSGHVFPQIGAIRVINSLMVNKLFAAKNAAGQSHIASSDHFDPETAEDLVANHQDGSRTFLKKPNAPDGSGIYLIPQGQSAPDTDTTMQMATSFQSEVSSTPPSMQGLYEGSASGVLNEQRIAQSSIQSQLFAQNFMSFLTRRANLWKYYWKEYFTAEQVIRILEKKDDKDQDWVAINQIVNDEFGNPSREKTFDDADAYDMTFEDSWRSPTVRDKVRKQLSEMMQNGSLNNDPELAAEVYSYFLQLSDAPQDFKSRVKAIADAKKQAQEAAQQAGPQQDPMRLSMSVKSEDLSNPNTILLLEETGAISPEVANQMRTGVIPSAMNMMPAGFPPVAPPELSMAASNMDSQPLMTQPNPMGGI